MEVSPVYNFMNFVLTLIVLWKIGLLGASGLGYFFRILLAFPAADEKLDLQKAYYDNQYKIFCL